MSRDDLESLMHAWDEMDQAAQRMSVAQPAAMTGMAADLEVARLNMRSIVQRVAKNANR